MVPKVVLNWGYDLAGSRGPLEGTGCPQTQKAALPVLFHQEDCVESRQVSGSVQTAYMRDHIMHCPGPRRSGHSPGLTCSRGQSSFSQAALGLLARWENVLENREEHKLPTGESHPHPVWGLQCRRAK